MSCVRSSDLKGAKTEVRSAGTVRASVRACEHGGKRRRTDTTKGEKGIQRARHVYHFKIKAKARNQCFSCVRMWDIGNLGKSGGGRLKTQKSFQKEKGHDHFPCYYHIIMSFSCLLVQGLGLKTLHGRRLDSGRDWTSLNGGRQPALI